LVLRQPSTTDRRRITLMLTSEGLTLLNIALQGTQYRLGCILKELPREDLDLVTQAMLILQPIFAKEASSSNVKELSNADSGG